MATVDYAAIAAKKIRKPGGRPPRFLIYGRNKQGKTSIAATAPNVLIIDPESGTEFLDPDAASVWPVTNWGDINEVFQYLRTGKHNYDWVCLDGLTRITNMSLRFVMKQQEERDLDRIPGMVQQRDYGKSGELIKGMLFNFHSLPMGVIYTAQDRMEAGGYNDMEDDEVEDAEARFVPDLPKGVRSSVNAIVDVIGRVYTVKVEGTSKKTGKQISGVQRRLWIAPSGKYDTGYRSKKRLPDFVKAPTVPKLVDAIR